MGCVTVLLSNPDWGPLESLRAREMFDMSAKCDMTVSGHLGEGVRWWTEGPRGRAVHEIRRGGHAPRTALTSGIDGRFGRFPATGSLIATNE